MTKKEIILRPYQENIINEIMNKKAKHKHLFTRKDINGKTICFSCKKIKYTREKK